MRLNTKRFISGILIAFFFIYSLVIYTVGTRVDKGEKWITQQSGQGKLVFQKRNCIACHQLFGLGGYMGPDLTNVISANGKGPVYVRQFLQNGTTRMPNYHLSEEEVNDLVAYLTYTDKTGISPVKDFKINYNGTVNWKHDDEKGN
ncbi:MAG: cytochrome c [Bacteroidota bacterium]